MGQCPHPLVSHWEGNEISEWKMYQSNRYIHVVRAIIGLVCDGMSSVVNDECIIWCFVGNDGMDCVGRDCVHWFLDVNDKRLHENDR